MPSESGSTEPSKGWLIIRILVVIVMIAFPFYAGITIIDIHSQDVQVTTSTPNGDIHAVDVYFDAVTLRIAENVEKINVFHYDGSLYEQKETFVGEKSVKFYMQPRVGMPGRWEYNALAIDDGKIVGNVTVKRVAKNDPIWNLRPES